MLLRPTLKKNLRYAAVAGLCASFVSQAQTSPPVAGSTPVRPPATPVTRSISGVITLSSPDGNLTVPQRLTNVAPGSTANDAVNFGQLKRTDSRVAKLEDRTSSLDYFSANTDPVASLDANLVLDFALSKGPKSVAAGQRSYADGESSIAVGASSWVFRKDGVSVGREALVQGEGGIALGASAQSVGAASTVIGVKARELAAVENKTMDVQYLYRARLDEKGFPEKFAFGGAEALPIATTVVGSRSIGLSGSTAIGASVIAAAEAAVAVGAGATAEGGSSVAVGAGSYAPGRNGVAVGKMGAASGFKSIAIGYVSTATGVSSIAVGSSALASGDRAIALGNSPQGIVESRNAPPSKANFQDMETNTRASGVDSIAFGTSTDSAGDGGIAIGSRARVEVAADSAISIGTDASAAGAGDVVIGGRATATGAEATAVGSGASARYGQSVALGAGSVTGDSQERLSEVRAYVPSASGQVAGTSPVGEVSVGSEGKERRVTNVAAGGAPADAVNVSQLNDMQDWSREYTDQRFQPIGASIGGLDRRIDGVGVRIDGLNQRIDGLDRRMGAVSQDANAGVAAALAASQIAQPYQPGMNAIGAAVGTYRGQSSLAFGVSTISDGGRWVIKAAATRDTRGSSGATVGATMVW